MEPGDIDKQAACCRSVETPNVGRLLRAMIAAEPCDASTGATPDPAAGPVTSFAGLEVRSQAPILSSCAASGSVTLLLPYLAQPTYTEAETRQRCCCSS